MVKKIINRPIKEILYNGTIIYAIKCNTGETRYCTSIHGHDFWCGDLKKVKKKLDEVA